MKYLITGLILFSAAQASAMECKSSDPFLLITVTKNPEPRADFPLHREYMIHLIRDGKLVKQEPASMAIGIASNFFTGDTLFLDDGAFKSVGQFADRAEKSNFEVVCR